MVNYTKIPRVTFWVLNFAYLGIFTIVPVGGTGLLQHNVDVVASQININLYV